jgi:signal transduction histidine kinase
MAKSAPSDPHDTAGIWRAPVGAEQRAALALERFAESHNDMRRAAVLLPSSAVFAALACLPLVAGVRESAPTPFGATALWGVLAIAVAWVAYFTARKWGTKSRAYRCVDDLESIIVPFGAAVLVGVGGRATSAWWLLYFAACVYMASAGGRRPFNGLLLLGAAIVAPVLLARYGGRDQALIGLAIGSMGLIAWGVIATSSDRLLDRRAERDALASRVRTFETERERRHLVRELHDSVGSALSLAALYGDVLERGQFTNEKLAHLAAGLRSSAKDGLNDLRMALQAINPAATSLPATATAMREMGARLNEATGTEVSVDISADTERALEQMDPSLRLTFFRVFQEAAQNAIRHGRASRIAAVLAISASGVELSIADDGSGIGSEVPEGRGLSGMRQRAAERGGSVVIRRSQPGPGSVLQFFIPVIWPHHSSAR